MSNVLRMETNFRNLQCSSAKLVGIWVIMGKLSVLTAARKIPNLIKHKIHIYHAFPARHIVIISSCLHWPDGTFKDLPWGSLDDVVMGGVSQSTFQIDPTGGEDGGPTGIFRGLFLSTCSFILLHSFLNLCFSQVLFPPPTMVAFLVSEQR